MGKGYMETRDESESVVIIQQTEYGWNTITKSIVLYGTIHNNDKNK